VRPIAFLLTAFLVVCSPVGPDPSGDPDPAVAPRLASVSPGSDDVRVAPGVAVQFHVEATSPRARTLTITFLVDGLARATASSFSFQPATAGSYRVSAVVSDGELEVVHEWTVTVEPPNASPAVLLSIEPASGAAPLTARIRVQGDDPDGRVVRHRLELVGPRLLTLERPFPIDTILTLDAGSWQATAVVEDDGGATAVAGRGIEVAPPNLPPAPDLRVEPQSGEAPLEVVVDAGGTDPDGEIASYRLDIQGESITESASPIRRSARFEQAGAYRVRLSVTDDRGAEARDSLTIHVTERTPETDPPDPPPPPPPSEVAPTASLLVTPTEGEAPLEVGAHVTGQDADGSVATIRIDFDGDGVADASGGGASLDASFRYESAGTYSVTATAVDDDGLEGTAVAHVTVRPPSNLPPSGSLSLSVTSGDAPLEVRATASGSDPDGRIVKWEIEAHAGDGFLELDASRSATLVYAFQEADYAPRLRLTDDAGAVVTIEGAAVRVYRPIAGGEATVEGNPRFDATAIAPAVWSDGQDRWRFSVTVRDREGEPLANVRLRLASDRPALTAPDGTPLGPGMSLVSGELRTAADGTASGMLTTTLSTRIERAPVIDFRPFGVRIEADAGHGQWREVGRLEGLNANSTVSATASRVIVRPANEAVCPGTSIEIEVQARSRTDAPSPGAPAAGRYAELRFTDGSLVSVTPRTGYAAWRTDGAGVIRFAYAPTRADQSKLVEAWVDGQPIGELAILALQPPSKCSS
jgi:PKD repeat protein